MSHDPARVTARAEHNNLSRETKNRMASQLSSPSDYEALIEKYDTWLFDCDGVLWQGNKLIDGAVEVLKLLRSRSKYNLHIFVSI